MVKKINKPSLTLPVVKKYNIEAQIQPVNASPGISLDVTGDRRRLWYILPDFPPDFIKNLLTNFRDVWYCILTVSGIWYITEKSMQRLKRKMFFRRKQTRQRMPQKFETNNELCFFFSMMNFFCCFPAQIIHIRYCFLCKEPSCICVDLFPRRAEANISQVCTKVTVSSLPANPFIKGRISCR